MRLRVVERTLESYIDTIKVGKYKTKKDSIMNKQKKKKIKGSALVVVAIYKEIIWGGGLKMKEYWK